MMIEAEHLTMHYGSVVALDDASFVVNTGEILGLLGPNGAGKSTIMKILTTFLYPTAGTARVGGKDVRTEPVEVRKLIGYLPEVLPLYRDMEVADYLRFVGNGRGLRGEALRQRTDWVLDRTGLRPMYRRPIRELSKGYLQRTALAQALIHDPRIVILDEPTSGLDPHQILEIRRLIRELAQEKTVIFSTHILHEVEAISDRVVIINLGRIVADGTLSDLSQRARASARAEARIKGEAQDLLQRIQGLDAVSIARLLEADGGWNRIEAEGSDSALLCEQLYRTARENDWELKELKEKPFTLEEIYLALLADDGSGRASGGGA